MISHTIPFIFETELKTATRNGSSASFEFSQAVEIPRAAREIFLQVSQAEIWNSFPNIEVGVNNLLVFSYANQLRVLSLPTGAFNVDAINATFGPQLTAMGLGGIIQLSEAVEQSKVIMTFDRAGVTYIASDSTLRTVIGFTQDVTSTPAQNSFFADSIAQFNVVNKLLLHTSLPVNGLILNGNSTNIIAKIPISATPGFQFIYAPFHPAKVPAPALAGFSIRNLEFWLTDENNNPVNTLGERWGFSLDLVYEDPPRFDLRPRL